MDKIKPILAHKFWFILGLAIVVSLVGWGMASSTISKTIEERTAAIKSAESNSKVQGEVPNEDWTKALKDVNSVQNQSVVKAEEFLFSIQSNQMTWPISVAVLMKDVPYRGKFINTKPLDRYRNVYRMELHRVWKTADPYDPIEDTGRVQLDLSVLPQVQNDLWRRRPPTWKEMWDAQEDLWLLEDILSSIANLNKDYRTIRESPVRVVESLLLKGGSRNANGEPVTGGGGMGEGDGEGEESAMKGGGGAGGLMAAMRGGMEGSGGGNQSGKVDFTPAEVFGSDAGADAGSEGEGEGGGASMQEESSGAEGDAKSSMGAMMGGMMGQTSKNAKRYVDNDESRPFKTRGFYLQVIMKHDQLPDLIAELTNSRWPVEILRVQQEDLHKDQIQGNDGGAQAAGIGGLSAMRSSAPGAGGASLGLGAGGGESGGLAGLSAAGGGFGASVAELGGADGDAGGQPMSRGVQGAGTTTLAAAKQDRGLARVAIAGLMTLYSPPPPPPETEMANAADGTAPPSDGSENPPPQDGNQPATGDAATADPDAAPDATAAGDAAQNTDPAATSPTAPQPNAPQPDAPQPDAPASGGEPANKPSTDPADATEPSPPATDEKPPAAEKQPAATEKQPPETTNDKKSQ